MGSFYRGGVENQKSKRRSILHETGLEGKAAFTNVGGRVEFRRLPSGSWIVSDWYIRMPRVYHILGTLNGMKYSRDTLLGYVDRAGRAEPVSSATAMSSRAPAILTGVLFDSLAMAPLVGAEVRVGGAPETARSDSAGRFRLSVAEPEERVVTVRHPRLGLVSDRSVQSVRFYSGREATITAAVPTVAAFVAVLCPGCTAGRKHLRVLRRRGDLPVPGDVGPGDGPVGNSRGVLHGHPGLYQRHPRHGTPLFLVWRAEFLAGYRRFSSLEPIPLILLVVRAWMEYRSIRAEGKEFPYRWPLYFLTASQRLELHRRRDVRVPHQPPHRQLLRTRHLPDQQPRSHGPLRRLRHAGHRADPLLLARPGRRSPLGRRQNATSW